MLCCLALGAIGSSQATGEEGELSLGVMGGLALGQMSPSYLEGTQSSSSSGFRTGITLGIQFEIPIASQWYLQPELLYLQTGESGANATGDLRLHLDYVDVPILIKAKFGDPSLSFEAFAGPSFRVNIARKVVQSGVGTSPQEIPLGDSDGIRQYDVGLHAGAGVEFKVDDGARLFFTGRYALGWLNDSKNRTIIALLGARFGL